MISTEMNNLNHYMRLIAQLDLKQYIRGLRETW